MSRPLAIALVAVVLLSGCGLTPRQRAFLVSSAALSLALTLEAERGEARRIATPADPCTNPEACR